MPLPISFCPSFLNDLALLVKKTQRHLQIQTHIRQQPLPVVVHQKQQYRKEKAYLADMKNQLLVDSYYSNFLFQPKRPNYPIGRLACNMIVIQRIPSSPLDGHQLQYGIGYVVTITGRPQRANGEQARGRNLIHICSRIFRKEPSPNFKYQRLKVVVKCYEVVVKNLNKYQLGQGVTTKTPPERSETRFV